MAFGALLLAAAPGSTSLPAFADYSDGRRAEITANTEQAVYIWRKAAWQNGEFLSAIKLGDLYGDDRGNNRYYDPVEAYVWYYLATKSHDLAAYIGDRYLHGIIVDDYRRAQIEQEQLSDALSVDERDEARRRIIYILSCRGADGFITLGQIYGFGDRQWDRNADIERDPRDRVARQSPGFWHGLKVFWDRIFYGRAPVSDIELPPPSAPLENTAASSVIGTDYRSALVYFHIASDMGHPFAARYLKGLEGQLQGDFGQHIVTDAVEKARRWFPPYEFYPAGDSAGGTPYTDMCYSDFERRRALELVPISLPSVAVRKAFWFLGWLKGPFPDARAIQLLQVSMGETPNGHLSPEEAVRLIQMAALKGDAASQNTLGVMYARGVGVQKNYPRALYWFMKAGDQRFAPALYHLSILYRVGPDGIHQDKDKASVYLAASALAGFRPTMNQLQDLITEAEAQKSHKP